ncbi:MAG TPA: pseudouridine synthase [Polyangiaceae bacterium]|nr:pseudouridine synthase [Polyangiaceae bacterium]
MERALSKLGAASRSVAHRAILNGQVTVGGRICRDPGLRVSPERDVIALDGLRLRRAKRLVLVVHKQRGTLTARRGSTDRPTVFDVIPPELGELHAVGRLDFATSGLLLLTNDTRLSAFLTDPLNGIPRVYRVSVRGEFESARVAQLLAGVEDAGERLFAEHAELSKASGRESHLRVTLSEGKNREVRRLFAALGHEVTRLCRVAYGGIELGELAPGKHRVLSEPELKRAFPTYPGWRSR